MRSWHAWLVIGLVIGLGLGTIAVAQTSALRETAAASAVSVRSGNWSDASTWSIGRVPGATDPVTVSSGHTVTYDVSSSRFLINSFASPHEAF